MRRIYRCGGCATHFRGRRRLCGFCGTTGVETGRERCDDCGSTFEDSPIQRCPVCGSGEFERVGRA